MNQLASLGEPTPIKNPLIQGTYEIGSILSSVIGIFILVATITSFVFLITAGLQWLTSGGDKNSLESARNKMVAALVGLGVVASVWALTNLLFPALGLSFPDIKLPTLNRGLE